MRPRTAVSGAPLHCSEHMRSAPCDSLHRVARSLSGEQSGVQIGFYDFIVKGMYQSWGEFLPVCGGTVCSHGSENRERWVQRKETDAALAKGA